MTETGDSSEAHEAQAGALLLALLISLWGIMSLGAAPATQVGAPRLQIFLCAPAIGFFVARWRAPQLRIAQLFLALAMAYTLVVLPWSVIASRGDGYPWEAFTLPDVAIIYVAFVMPRRLWLGLLLIGAFTGLGLFAYFYLGTDSSPTFRPITQPYATLGFALLSVAVFLTRHRRALLGRQFVKMRAESAALHEVSPLFDDLRAQLARPLAVIDAALETSTRTEPRLLAMGRAVRRLGSLSHRVASLGRAEDDDHSDAQERLLDHDAHLGVTVLCGLGVAVGALAALMMREVSGAMAWAFAGCVGLDALLLGWLWTRRTRPSRRRATGVLLFIVVTALPLASLNQLVLANAQQPYLPFFCHKYLMVALGITAASRFGLSLAFIILAAADALALYCGIRLTGCQPFIAPAEPWLTLVFLLIGLNALRLREQRRLASLQVLQAEVEVEMMRRRAAMILSLRDRLNTPLQTLVLGSGSSSALPPHGRLAVRDAVAELVRLSRRLAQFKVHIPAEAWRAPLDAERVLPRSPSKSTRPR